nr:hypothetical protein [Escherichia coli]
MGHAAGGEGCALQSAPDQRKRRRQPSGDHRHHCGYRASFQWSAARGIHPDSQGD